MKKAGPGIFIPVRPVSLSVVCFLVLGRDIDLALLRHLIACEVLVIGADLVDQRAVRQEFHNAVCRRLDDLVVMRREEDNARKLDHAVIKGRDRLHIEMVCRLIENEDIGPRYHHL